MITKFFFRDDGPTVIKKRYLHQYLNQKLFEINFINDLFVSGPLEEKINGYLEDVIAGYDVVLLLEDAPT